MAKDESFDITTGCDLQEVDNAVNQARKEISTRFDFKGVLAEIEYDRQKAVIDVHTADEYKLEAIWQVLSGRLIARNVPLKNIKRGDEEKAGGGTLKQQLTLKASSLPGQTLRTDSYWPSDGLRTLEESRMRPEISIFWSSRQ